MNSTQQSQRPQSLLTMLPPEVQKQVLLLIKRLGDEKQARQQIQKKCIMQEQQIQQLKKQIEKLKKQNLTLKTKWENSFSMISKVRQNFSESKKNLHEGQGKKKLRFNKQQNEWTEQQQSQKEEKQTFNKEIQPSIRMNQQLKDNQNSQKYFSIQQRGIPEKTMPSIQISRSLEKTTGLDTLPMMTAKKPPRQQVLQQSSSRSKLSNKSNKKLQIQSLKQEIQSLTQQIKTKQMGNMSLADKMRRCEEIKSRYKKGVNLNNVGREQQRMDECHFVNDTSNINNESFMINSGQQSPRKYQQSQQQPSLVNYQQQHQQQHQQSSYTPVYSNQQITTPKNSNMLNRVHQVKSWKENVMINDSHTSIIQMSQKPYTNNNLSQQQQQLNQQQKAPQLYQQQQQSQQQRIQSNSSFLNNTSAIYSTSKITIKQPNQSFYDDGLLDLIQQMNP